MNLRASESRDYPFTEENLEATLPMVDQFIADPPLSAAERVEILEFVRLTRQFAFLEQLIQGDVLCDLPIHFDRLTLDSDETLGERMAEREIELLELGIEPAETLMEALDQRGIKVFRRSHGPEPPDILTGGFCFDGASGPALLSGAVDGCPDAIFVVAHEYGHLVMDIDPYASRFCRWRRADMANCCDSLEERRADRFARALLLPPSTMSLISADLAPNDAGTAPDACAIGHSAIALDVSPAVLWRRLIDLGLPRPDLAPDPQDVDECREVDDRRPTDLPERFVNLALAAYGQRMMGKKTLSRFLRIPPERVDQFLTWCPIPREPRRPEEEDDSSGSAD